MMFDGLLRASRASWKYVSAMNQHPASLAWAALPAELSNAIGILLEGRGRKALAERASHLSSGFRARRSSQELLRGEEDALAYALTRLPATYAANAAILRRLLAEAPAFSPTSLLDAGCGLASASFAALEAWPNIGAVSLLDKNPAFLALVEWLRASSRHAALVKAKLLRTDLAAIPGGDAEADLVVASYALTEISDGALGVVVEGLWAHAREALIIVEPGTPRDHERLMTTRERLIRLGARIALPCPHERPCPLAPPEWCHFAARLPRSRDHKLLKAGEVPFEDEKYCYLIAFRNTSPPRGARVVAHPRASKWGLELRLCGPRGLKQAIVAKRDKASFQIMRKVVWGDSVPTPEGEEKP